MSMDYKSPCSFSTKILIYENIYKDMNEKQKKIIDSLLGILTTPVAKRKGVYISPEECKIWAEELEYVKKLESENSNNISPNSPSMLL